MSRPDVSSDRVRNLVELNFAVLLFGGVALFAKLIELPVVSIIFGRSLIAAVALLAFVLVSRTPVKAASRRDFLMLVAAGLIMAAHWLAYFRAIQVSTVAIGIISLHTYPVITVLLEPVVERKRLHLADAALAVVVLVGIGILLPEFSLESSVTRGVVWGVLSAVLFTVRNLIVRRYVQRYSGATVMLYQTSVAALALLPVVAATGSLRAVAGPWWQFLLLGTVFTALTQSLYAASLRNLSAKTVSIVSGLLPLYSTVAAIFILGEIPTVRTVVGGIFVVGAVMVETIRAASGSRKSSSRRTDGSPGTPGRGS